MKYASWSAWAWHSESVTACRSWLWPAEACITSFCDFTCPIIGQSNVCGLPHEETNNKRLPAKSARAHGEFEMGIKPQGFLLSRMCGHVLLATIFRSSPYLNLIETVVVMVQPITSGSAMNPAHSASHAVFSKGSDSMVQPVSLPASLSGQSHKRFVIVSTLLHLIDPVRGEPTTHSLDRHPHDDSWKRDQLQKKFLDSFALISSTSRIGGDTASAVCLEQGHPGGTVLRLARNLGISDEHLVSQLQEVLDDLTAVALKGIKPIKPTLFKTKC